MQSNLDHGPVAVFGRISSGGATPETASGPNAAKVAIPQMTTTRARVIPTGTAPSHLTPARVRIAIDIAIVFATISQKTTPHSVARPNATYEPRGYMIATAPSATTRPAMPKDAYATTNPGAVADIRV